MEHQSDVMGSDGLCKNNTPAPTSACFNGPMTLDNWAIELSKSSLKSPSWRKLKHVLTLSKTFHVQLYGGIFSSITDNLVLMLKGFGLQQIFDKTLDSAKHSDTITVETSYFSGIKKMKSCVGPRCEKLPRIIIQTEQKRAFLPEYFAKCHSSSNCVILEFSTYNYYQWHSELQVQGSVFLLPHVIQNRLDNFAPTLPKPISERKYDVVHFGVMSGERVKLKKALEEQHPDMTVLIETNTNMTQISAAYMDAKTCVIVHSHSRISAGEYHRISDFAKFGCVPIVETIADTDVGLSFLTECAGMVSADLDELVPSIVRVLEEEIHFDDMQARMDWWNNGIEWATLLKRIFSSGE